MRRVEKEVSIGAKHAESLIAEVVPGTMKVNVPLTMANFEVRIPNGTEVRDLNLGTRHFQGGTSRSRQTVSSLADEARSKLELPPQQPVSPKSGAVTSDASFSWRPWGTLGGVVLALGIVTWLMFRRRG